MLLDIKEGASLKDAEEIEEIVKKVHASMDELHNVFNKNIPEGIETDWSLRVKDTWDRYYETNIPEVMEGIRASAENLKKAVDDAVNYSKDN